MDATTSSDSSPIRTITTMSPTLASAPGGCCFSGVKHTGTPVGRVEDLGGIQTYISDPPASATTHKVILYLSDIWGSLFFNNKLIQDYFASCGASRFFCLYIMDRN
jgi:hypothetical protein